MRDEALVDQLRARLPGLSILAISGGDAAVFAKARGYGAAAGLRKPFDWATLEAAINDVLRQQSS